MGNPGNPGPGGDNSKMILLVVVVLAFVMILLWLWSQKKEEDKPDGNGYDPYFPLDPINGNGGDPITGVYYDTYHHTGAYTTSHYWDFGEARLVMSLHAELRGGGDQGGLGSITKIYYRDLNGKLHRIYKGEVGCQDWEIVDLAPMVKCKGLKFSAERDFLHWAGWIDEVVASITYDRVS